jgi:hypothetical protein
VGTTEDNGRVAVLREYSPHLVQLTPVRGRESQPRNALDYQVVLGQSACLVEAANIDLACHWDAVWLSAKDLLLHELDDREVNGDRELHGELRRDDISNNEDATKHNLVAAPVGVLETLR